MITMDPKFKIGEKVFYAISEGEQGLVTDISYQLSSNIIWYHVTFSPNSGEIACRDFELTRERQII